MQRYILKRIFYAIMTMIAITVIVFFLQRLMGDPVALMVSPDADEEAVEALKKKLGLLPFNFG